MYTEEQLNMAAERMENDYFKPLAQIREIRIPDAEYKLKHILSFLLRKKGQSLKWLPAYDEVAQWLGNNGRKGLLIMGNCGTGKSLLCCNAIPMLLHLELYKNFYAIPAWSLSDVWKKHLNDDICIIDDVGMEPVGMRYGEPIHAFATMISNADQKGQLMILTTNLNTEDLLKKYDARVMDRIRGSMRTIAIPGASFR